MSRSTRQPWVTDQYRYRRSTPKIKRYHNRRYRRVIRTDVKQWRYRYLDHNSCATCDCLDEYWDEDDEIKFWRECLSLELDPGYPPYKKFTDAYDICDYRSYCDEPEHRRK